MSTARRHGTVRHRNDAYQSRFLAALAVTVLAALILANLPISLDRGDRVGWQVIRNDEIIAIDEVRFEDGLSRLAGAVATIQTPAITDEVIVDEIVEGGEVQDEVDDTGTAELPAQASRVRQMERLVLAAAETMPEIEGGLGAYYINIEYPQDAIDRGIQGRVVLDFIVEPDGKASDINVYAPLHPLCDSAAVRALRQTLFMPGRNGGQAVAVRMRLPVLFQIVRSSVDSLRTGT